MLRYRISLLLTLISIISLAESVEAAESLVINEFIASNSSDGSIADAQGQYDDWIEIHNYGPDAIDIGGMYLTDDLSVPAKWQIPDETTISEGGYILIWADNDTGDAGLHANFKLDADGEEIGLFDIDGETVIDSIEYPEQIGDMSYGRYPDAGNDWRFFDIPSPEQENEGGYLGVVADTKFSLNRGFYNAPFSVTITTETEDADIYYSLDGSEPFIIGSNGAITGTIYTGPILIDRTTCLRAMAYKEDWLFTNVDTQTYIFLDDVIASSVMNTSITQNPTYAPQMRDALTDLPTISIATPPGILEPYLPGPGPYPDWTYDEVPASVEWIMPDSNDGFQENVGVSRFGGHWYDKPSKYRPFDKWSFRIYFRGQYGAKKLRFPLFEGYDYGISPVEVFDRLDLHAGHHDMSQRGFYMSSRLTEDTMLDIGNLNPHGRFVHLYINGVYWGQYNLHERWNADMLAEYLGGEKENYEAIKTHVNQGGWNDMGEPYDGDGSAWQRVLSLRDSYEALQGYLDFQNYIDFMLMYAFGRSEAEFRCVGPIEQGSGFKMWLNDADGFTRSASNRAYSDGPGKIFSSLFNEGHIDYMTLLADRAHKHFFNDGAMTPANMTARLLKRCTEIERSFIAEAARWGYRSPTSWENAKNDYINNVLSTRTAAVVDELRAAGLYPATDAPEFSRHGGDVPSGFELTMTASAETVYYTVDGSDPRLPGGAISPTARLFEPSASTITTKTLLGEDAGVSAYVPTDDTLGTSWTELGFTGDMWRSSTNGAGVGYDEASTYLPYIDLSVESQMNNVNTTVYIRYEFQLDDPSQFTGLELSMRYDDGYVAYLNGQVIASRNAPGTLSWNSSASANHSDSAAVGFEKANITHPASLELLQAGANVLAIHGLNTSLSSTDMLIEPELRAITSMTSSESDKLTISDAVLIKARTLNGFEWSALTEAFFTVDGSPAILPGDLAITEIHYNPQGSSNMEFIELTNVSDRAINLRGVRFSLGIEFAFPENRDTPMAPGQRIVLVKSEFDFLKQYGFEVPITGIYRTRPDNDGESLEIVGPDSTPLLHLTSF